MPWPLTDFRLALLHWAGGSIFSVQQEFAAFILIEIGKRETWAHASGVTLHSRVDSKTSGVDVACSWSASIGYMSFTWLTISVVVFVLRTHYPISVATFNFASASLGGILVLVWLAWWLSGRFWFAGPITDVNNSDVVKIHSWVSDPPRQTSFRQAKVISCTDTWSVYE